MATTEQFSLRWNNFHSNLTSGFHDLMQANDMVDVTLAVEGQFLQAHKIVLSICSPMFKQLFKISPCKHPVIILRDVTYGNLKDILEFMYLGEVNVLRDNLSAFLRTAELLQVKGLTGDDSSDTSSKKDEKLDSVCDNDLDQDIQQFNQLIESSESSVLPHYSTSRLPTPPPTSTQPVSSSKRVAKNPVGSAKRAKSENTNTSKSTSKSVEKHERSFTPTQLSEEDLESESPTPKLEATSYGSESEDAVPNKDVIKQLLEANSVNVSATQDSSSQDHARCRTCGKFMRKSSLRRHMLDVHFPTQQLPCDICHKLFKTANSLTTHLITIHRQLKSQRQSYG